MLATTHRTNGRLSYELGTYEINRLTLRHNQVIVPRKLALAVAGLKQENGGWREPSFHDKERLFTPVTFSPTDRITLRAMGERGHEHRAVVAPFPACDGALAWIDNRNARGVNAVTFTPNNANPTAAQIALGVTARNVALNATNRRFIFIDNNSTFFDSSGTFITGSCNNPAVRAPDGTPGVSGVTLSFHDPSILPYDINSGGPGIPMPPSPAPRRPSRRTTRIRSFHTPISSRRTPRPTGTTASWKSGRPRRTRRTASAW